MSGRRFGHLARFLSLSSAPSGAVAGDAWYRSDLAQFRGSDGLTGEHLTIGPDGNLPVISTTRWHLLPAYGSQATANVPVDRMFALPFWPSRKATITAVAANVTLALVGGNLRFGLYNANAQGLPSTLVADYGTVGAGLSGVRSITGLTTVVRPVLYYLIVGRQGGVLNLGLTTRATGDPIVSETSPTIAGDYSGYYMTGVSGALPATFTNNGVDTAPSIAVQLT